MTQVHPAITRIKDDFVRILLFKGGVLAPQDISMLFEAIMNAYGKPHRHHHTVLHLMEMHEIIEDRGIVFDDPDAVKMAILLHDIAHDVRRHKPDYTGESNETISANYAIELLKTAGLPEDFYNRVAELILYTETHNCSGSDRDGCLFLDVDMAVIGLEQERYNEYAIGVAKEALVVFTPDQYQTDRQIFLGSLQQRNRLFHTGLFEEMYGSQSRENIVWERKELKNLIAIARNIRQVSEIHGGKHTLN